MKPLKQFSEFLEEGIIRKKTPDLVRANSLVNEAEKRKRFLSEMNDKIGVSDENANYFIENVYDTLMELIRAKLLAKGYKSSGEGAHEAEVSFLRNIDFPEPDVRFMNELRYFRNGIKYYGKDFDKEVAGKALLFLDKVYPRLKEVIQEEEDNMELSEKTKRDIKQAEKEFKEGKYKTFKQVRKELRL